jgi:hypothetical protein
MSRGRMMMIAEDFRLEQLPLHDEHLKQKYYDNPLTDFYRNIRRKYKSWFYVWQCLFRRSAITDIRFVETLRAGGEDNLFMFEAVSKIKNFVQIDDIVACHRFSKISVTLNGYEPQLYFGISEIIIPYIYQKYALNTSIDKRLLWWVYHKESYAIYRYLIRNILKKDKVNSFHQATYILKGLVGTPAFEEVKKRWNIGQKIFFNLVINRKYNLAKKFKLLS